MSLDRKLYSQNADRVFFRSARGTKPRRGVRLISPLLEKRNPVWITCVNRRFKPRGRAEPHRIELPGSCGLGAWASGDAVGISPFSHAFVPSFSSSVPLRESVQRTKAARSV